MAVKSWLQLFPVRSYYFWRIILLITPWELITRRFMTIEIIRSPRGGIYLVIGGGKPMDFRIQCYSAGRIIFVNICLGIFTRRLIDPDSHLGLCIQNNVYPISDHRRRFIRKKFNTLHAPEREKKIPRMNIVWRRRRQHPPPSPQKTRSYKWNKLPGCCGN